MDQVNEEQPSSSESVSAPRPAQERRVSVVVSRRALSGILAKYAVQQSPYTVPDNLGSAVEQFMERWTFDNYASIPISELQPAILRTIEACPLTVAWNRPKVGNHEIVFVDRYSQPKPDYDFIDLWALSRNIAHEIIQEERALAEEYPRNTAARDAGTTTIPKRMAVPHDIDREF